MFSDGPRHGLRDQKKKLEDFQSLG